MFWAKALVITFMPCPGLKAGVIEIQQLMDFSPKFKTFRIRLKNEKLRIKNIIFHFSFLNGNQKVKSQYQQCDASDISYNGADDR